MKLHALAVFAFLGIAASPLLIVLVVVAGLILLYLVARKYRPFGQSLGFVCAVAGRLLVTLAYHLKSAAAYCNKACLASLRYPPGVHDGDYWHGVNVIARLALFALAVSVLGAEPVNTLLVLPALFQTTSTIHLPGVVELASAALFITAPALWGCAFLETCGLIPNGAGMFPHLGKWTRVIVGFFSGLFLVLAILVTGYLYLFRAAYLLDPQSTQGMSLYILGGLGLLTAASAVLALWAFVVGGAGVVSLLMWIAENILHILAAGASFLPDLLDIVALHLTQGTIGVFGKQRERTAHQFPPLYDATSPAVPNGQTAPALLPEHAASNGADTDEIVAVAMKELELPMTNPDKTSSVVLVGSQGSRMRLPLTQSIEKLKATGSILASAHLDLSTNPVQTAIPGIVDVTPTYAERKASTLHGKNEGEMYTTLLNRLAEKLVEAHLDTRATPATLLFVIDCHVLIFAVEMLETIKRRLPLHTLVVYPSISTLDVQNTTVQTGIGDLQSLVAEHIVETVIPTDSRSSFAATYGAETQQNFVAQGLVSLLLGQKHSPNNPTLTNVLQEFHTISPFLTLSFASKAIALGDVPKRWKWLPGVSRQPGAHMGDYSDIIAQAREVTRLVLTEKNTRAFPASVGTDTPCLVVYNTPIALSDPRFNAFVRDMALWVGSNFPHVSTMSVRGNGCAYPYHMGGLFLVQATALYPLQAASFPHSAETKSVKVTQLYPVTTALEPVTGNKPTPATRQTGKNKPASTSPKQRKPASRTSRKNLKQAQ